MNLLEDASFACDGLVSLRCDLAGTMGAGGALGGATVGDYGSGGAGKGNFASIQCYCGSFNRFKGERCCAGGMSGGIEGGTAGKSGQERKDVAGTGAGSGNSSADTAGRQIEGASGQGLSGQGGVF